MLSINIPYNLKTNIGSYRKIIRINKVIDKKYLKELIRFYSQNSSVLFFYVENLLFLDIFYKYGFRDLNILFPFNAKNLLLLDKYKNFISHFYLKASLDEKIKDEEVYSSLNYLLSLNIRTILEVDLFLRLNQNNFSTIKMILSDKKLLQNIEPFWYFYYFVKNRSSKRMHYDLWKLFEEDYKNFLYISDDGFVTLSKRFANKNLYFFHIKDKKEQRKKSFFYQRLKKYEKELLLNDTQCLFCKEYQFCKGFLKFENKNDTVKSCEHFRIILNEIEKEEVKK